MIDDEVADETVEGILLAELSGLEDEQTLMMKIIDIFNALITAPDSVWGHTSNILWLKSILILYFIA